MYNSQNIPLQLQYKFIAKHPNSIRRRRMNNIADAQSILETCMEQIVFIIQVSYFFYSKENILITLI